MKRGTRKMFKDGKTIPQGEIQSDKHKVRMSKVYGGRAGVSVIVLVRKAKGD